MPLCQPDSRQAQNRSNMYYTYAIKSTNRDYIYVGISDNPERRIGQHNKSYNKTTKPYVPFKTILIEQHDDRKAARIREKFLKSSCGKQYLRSIS